MSALHKVARAMNKGHPSSYYEQQGTTDNKTNPVFQAFEQNLQRIVTGVKKRTTPGYKTHPKEPACKLSDALSELWDNFDSRLPEATSRKNMIEVGDFLVCMQEYSLALSQCYDRYIIKWFGDFNPILVQDVVCFKQFYFWDGFDVPDAAFTLRALMGHVISSFHVIRLQDPRLLRAESLEMCVQLLSFLQIVMESILPKESFCWIIFNGTVHIYTISRYLMSLGHSALVIDFLLWASMCLETSIPLLSVKYLSWRSTLYTATCQCYNDCKSSDLAESFARRALVKINELSQLEKLSDETPSKENEISFRMATIKMAIMVYKRTVVESRRRPKGFLRPKNRINMKEVGQTPWPRTISEKLLASMFEGSSAQALALIEVLSDSNRRTLITSPPAAEGDIEILDLFVELFLSAQEIINGGGGSSKKGEKKGIVQVPGMEGLVAEQSLFDLAIRGENGITPSALVTLVKTSYSYQQYDFFDVWLPKTLDALHELNDPRLASHLLELRIIEAYDRATMRGKMRNTIEQADGDGKSGNVADFLNLANILLSVLNTSLSPCEELDMDMITDALLFLWNKFKAVFQHHQLIGLTTDHKYLEKIENYSKWLIIMEAVHKVVSWCGLGTIDPVMAGEMSLRLALVFESSLMLQMNTSDDSQFHDTLNDLQLVSSKSPLNKNILRDLQKARDILSFGLNNLSSGRDTLPPANCSSIADIAWVKEFNSELFDPNATGDIVENQRKDEPEISGEQPSKILSNVDVAGTKSLNTLSNIAKDLHTEMLFHYHRLCVLSARVANMISIANEEHEKSKIPWAYKSIQSKDLLQQLDLRFEQACEELLKDCCQDKLSQALFNAQKALIISKIGHSHEVQKKLLSQALHLLRHQEMDEKRLYKDNECSSGEHDDVIESNIPPPPILIRRTESSMVFRPANFKPASGQQIAWYRLFGHMISGSNLKARLCDNMLPGTGELISVYDKELKVTGLIAGEKYVFAIAVYSSDGQLIGESIGRSTKQIIAKHPMSLLIAWSFVSQVSYQLGFFDIALESFQVVWDYIVDRRMEPESAWSVRSIDDDGLTLTLHRLNMRVVEQTSPILLRSILHSIFIGVDSSMRQQNLFCDVLCDNGGLLTKGQVGRMQLCERMLLAVELSGWLNEDSLALQAVIQCYGLLAPMLYFKLSAVPMIQILERCVAVLQEMPGNMRLKYGTSTTDSLHHMIACIAYHLAKVLRFWGEMSLAASFNDIGRKLLSLNYDPDKDREPGSTCSPRGTELLQSIATEDKKSSGRTSKRSKTPSKTPSKVDTKNSELNALESHIMQLNKQAQPKFELTGNEDQSILHGFIAYLPSAMAYKQVKKFKARSRYLEFLVQVVQKGLAEGYPEIAATWCEEAEEFLAGDGKSLSKKGGGGGGGKQKGDFGSNVRFGHGVSKTEGASTFRAAVVEYSKEREKATTKVPKDSDDTNVKENIEDKSQKKNLTIALSGTMTESAKQLRIELENKARVALKENLTNVLQTQKRRQKEFRTVNSERPWRCQLNVIHGLCHFATLMKKMQSINPAIFNFTDGSSFLDPEWFHLYNSKTLLHREKKEPKRKSSMVDLHDGIIVKDTTLVPYMFPIEKAADAVAVASTQGISPKSDTKSTSRQSRNSKRKGAKEEEEKILSINRNEMMDSMSKTLDYFSRAIVLAHRGRHWTLLQNICKDLWNCYQMILIVAKTPFKTDHEMIDDSQMRMISWRSILFAADSLLDMLVQLDGQANSICVGKELLKRWMTEERDRKRVTGLKMNCAMDDTSTVDLHSVRRVVLHAIQLLHSEEKWEKLINIALRFNALSNYAFAEVVNPLLIHAQQKLCARIIENDGNPDHQPHLEIAILENGGEPIGARQFLSLQFKVQLHQDDLLRYTATDPVVRSLQLSSVPLDVTYSLQNFRDVLEKTLYSSRSLENSRKLLSLFLAGQNKVTSIEPSDSSSRQELVSKSGHRHVSELPVEYDKEQHFLRQEDVESQPILKSDIDSVIHSYENTIAILHKEGRTRLEMEARRELGNLHLFNRNVRGSYKQWTCCLNVLLNTEDAVHQWRTLLKNSNDFALDLVNKCGLWGCLIGGILCSNLAEYLLSSEVHLKTECCFLSGHFFKGLLRSSLPHPINDRSYAEYWIGERSEVTDLIPGVDLLSDRFRCDGKTVVAAMRFIIDELSQQRHLLCVLPLIALYQYFTTYVCRDLKRTVENRILKIRILTDLGLLSEASLSILRLYHGEHLPQPFGSSFYQVEPRVGPEQFKTHLPITEETNLTILETIAEKRLSLSLCNLYGPHLTCSLAVALSHFLITVADFIPFLPKMDEPIVAVDTTRKKSPPKSNRSGISSGASSMKHAVESTIGDDEPHQRDVQLDSLKGHLLLKADHILTTISSALSNSASEGPESLSASELETLIQSQLELATIYRQRHHALMAARTVFHAMKTIQESKVLNDRPNERSKKSKSPSRKTDVVEKSEAASSVTSTRYEYENFRSSSRLKGRLWLTCRLFLVKILLDEAKGMGQIKGVDQHVKVELADVDEYCRKGLEEAERLKDVESQAEFLFLGAVLHIINGKPVQKTILILQEVEKLLGAVKHLSTEGQLLLVNCQIHKADLTAIVNNCGKTSASVSNAWTSRISEYCDIQRMILSQLENLGERIERRSDSRREFSIISGPVRNLYLSAIPLLIQLKLHIGHALSQRAAEAAHNVTVSEAIIMWNEALSVFDNALDLSCVIVPRSSAIEAELLLYKGQIERQLMNLGNYEATDVGRTLLMAIKTSFASDHNLSLIRKAYLEMALIYLSSRGQASVSVSEQSLSDVKSDNSISKQKRTAKMKKEEEENRIIWLAISSAVATSRAQQNRQKISGNNSLLLEPIGETAVGEMPDFIGMDLIGSNVVGERLKIYKDEIEEEMAPLNEQLNPQPPVTYEDQMNRVKEAMAPVCWLNIIGYQNMLQRICSTSTVNTSEENITTYEEGHTGGSPRGLTTNKCSESQFVLDENMDAIMTSSRSIVVQSVLFMKRWTLRLEYVHRFLAKCLPSFAELFCAVRPLSHLESWFLIGHHQSLMVDGCGVSGKTYAANRCVTDRTSGLDSVAEESGKTSSKTDFIEPKVDELCVQWYGPSLERLASDDGNDVLFLYAGFSRLKGLNVGIKQVSMGRLLVLHSKLHTLTKKETLSAAKQTKESDTTTSSSKLEKQNIETKNAEEFQQLILQIQQFLGQSCESRQSLLDLGKTPSHASLPEEQRSVKSVHSESSITGSNADLLPFEMTKTNLLILEQTFNRAFGISINDKKLMKWFRRIVS